MIVNASMITDCKQRHRRRHHHHHHLQSYVGRKSPTRCWS